MIKLNNKLTAVSFYTLGCRLNQSETAVMERTFERDGYKIVDFKQPADVVIINTCTVTENGDADTRRLVNKVNRLNPKVKIALVGCQAQVQKEKLTELANVRWVVGNARKMDMAQIVRDVQREEPVVITPTISRDSFTIPMAGIDRRHTRANIKIQDGCDFFCSFCEIPYARGRARSREFTDILKEARELVAAGHQEIVITGINVGTYQNHNHHLVDVIDALEQIEGLARIRISSIEPTTIPEKLIQTMTKESKVCRYLHVPLQSGNNQVLTKMKRKYTSEEFLDFIEMAYAAVPQICIGTDIIVGFPSESESDFKDTLEKVREWPIHYFHVFSYSQRYMAKSRELSDLNAAPIIADRSKQLRDLSQRKRRAYYESLAGTTQDVLFEQVKEGAWQGLTDHYARVRVQSKDNLTNRICKVYLNKATDQCIEAELI